MRDGHALSAAAAATASNTCIGKGRKGERLWLVTGHQGEEEVLAGEHDAAGGDAIQNLAAKPVAPGTVPFTVVVNHFKSKSCGAPAPGPGDPNADTGQGCFNGDRLAQAGALLDLLADLATNRVLVIGDLNSYGEEDPIEALEQGGLIDLVDSRLPEADQYSYVFNGESGYLDHALATPALAGRVTGVDIWHINADEARFLDYNTEFNPEGYYRPDAYRSSDHDPVLVGIDLGAGKR